MNWSTLKQTFSPAQRFNRDTLWNLASLAVLAAAGIVLNILVARYWPPDALGVFNQVYAIYIVLSQLAVGGVHASVLREVSYQQDNPAEAALSATAGVILGMLLAGPVCGLAYLLSDAAGRWLESPGVSVGVIDVLPGLFFFSLNKILLNVLNGMRHMRAYAVFAALRFLFILTGVVFIYAMDIHFYHLVAAFSFAEVMLFVVLGGYISVKMFRPRIATDLPARLRGHLSFGVRGFLSGMVSDLNTRVDAVMLGWYFPDAVVGLYSMASTLAEGFYQLPVAVQRNVNPLVGKAFAAGDRARIEWMAKKTRRIMHVVMACISLIAIICYPIAMTWLFPGKDYEDSSFAFAILLVFISFQSGIAPMGGILFQGGRPGAQTWLMLIVVSVNIILNFLLIPLIGINGAALATGVAYVLQGILTLVFARNLLGIKLWL